MTQMFKENELISTKIRISFSEDTQAAKGYPAILPYLLKAKKYAKKNLPAVAGRLK